MATFDPAAIWPRVLDLAREAKPGVGTNPAVGAAVVRRSDGAIVSVGATGAPGTHHAEALAISRIPRGEDPGGLDLFVSLEPCAHQGRTPPCTRAILSADIRRVHVALRDLNPLVAGASAQALGAGGATAFFDAPPSIQRALFALNQAFHARMHLGRPWITAKWAMTLDGRIAARTGHARWVSGDESRRRVQALRRRVQAVAIGGQTALLDNPGLLARDDLPFPQPLRVVYDRRGLTPTTHRLMADPEPTVFFGSRETPLAFRNAVTASGKIWVEADSLEKSLVYLAEAHRIHEMLLEGGSALFGAFFADDLVDGVHVFIAPKILGDGSAYPVVRGGPSLAEMSLSKVPRDGSFAQSGEDMEYTGTLHPEAIENAWEKSKTF